MKLHRIAAFNINSLYGECSLDLDRDLRGSPLFLVQGPTGAGKSSLMDTVSLALFGLTPRLAELAGAGVGEAIMSRGTAQARAEVVFSRLKEGVRTRYRAVWTVRRAHNRSDGKIQAPHRSLEEWHVPSGTFRPLVSSDKQKDYDPLFAEVLEGFTAIDFQRSMLLAQGRFDQLLHAKPEERAVILERLTQSADYQGLGARAAEMNRAWSQRLELLAGQLAGVPALDPDRLAAARSAREEAIAEKNRLEEQRGVLHSALRWLGERQRLIGERRTVGEALRAARVRLMERGPDIQRIAEQERWAPAFDAWDRVQAAREVVTRLGRERERDAAAIGARQAAVRSADHAAVQADNRYSVMAADLETLRAPVAESQQKLMAVAQARERAVEAQRARVQAETAAMNASAAAERQAADAVSLRETADQAERSRMVCEVDAELLLALPGIERQEAQLVQLQGAVRKAEVGLEEHRRGVHQREARVRELRETGADWRRTVLDPLAAELKLRSQLWASLAAEPTTRERELVAQNGRFRERLREIGSLNAPLRDLRVVLTSLRERAQAVGEALAAHRGATLAEERAREAITARGSERVRAAELLLPLERLRDLADRRAELLPGTPCDLCGSLEHPYVDDPHNRILRDALDEEWRAAAANKRIAEQEEKDALQALSQAGARLAGERTRLRAAVAEWGRARQRWEEGLRSWSGHPLVAELSGEAEAPDTLRIGVPALGPLPAEADTQWDSELDRLLLEEGWATDLDTHARENVGPRGGPTVAAADRFSQALDASGDSLAECVRHQEARLRLSEQEYSTLVEAREAHALADRHLRAAQVEGEGHRRVLDQAEADWTAHVAMEAGLLQAHAEALLLQEQTLRVLEVSISPFGLTVSGGLAPARERANTLVSARKQAEVALKAAEIAAVRATAAGEAADRAKVLLGAADAQACEWVTLREQAERESQAALTWLDGVWATCADHAEEVCLRLPPEQCLRAQETRVKTAVRAREEAQSLRERAHQELTSLVSRVALLNQQIVEAGERLGQAEQEYAEVAQNRGFVVGEGDPSILRLSPMVLQRLRQVVEEARRDVDRAEAAFEASRQQWSHLATQRPGGLDPALGEPPEDLGEAPTTHSDAAGPAQMFPSFDPEAARARSQTEELTGELARTEETLRVVEEARLSAETLLRQSEANAERRAVLENQRREIEVQAAPWRSLHELIGVANGQRFREFAQALNLRQLIDRANRHLVRLSPRYQLDQEVDPSTGLPTLIFTIRDRFQAVQTRAPKTLSGGESFLVSLSLALGLSDLRNAAMPIETLLLDEGFGTLDNDTLEVALAALGQLHAAGRQVGIISHVSALQERIPARVLIEPLGEGRSRIRVA